MRGCFWSIGIGVETEQIRSDGDNVIDFAQNFDQRTRFRCTNIDGHFVGFQYDHDIIHLHIFTRSYR